MTYDISKGVYSLMILNIRIVQAKLSDFAKIFTIVIILLIVGVECLELSHPNFSQCFGGLFL